MGGYREVVGEVDLVAAFIAVEGWWVVWAELDLRLTAPIPEGQGVDLVEDA